MTMQINSETQDEPIVKKENCSHQADCMKMIQMAIDGEATPEQMQQVSQNLGKCLPCEKSYNLEKAIREALQLRIEKRCVPSSLINCIKQKIGL
jgi:anti-sigma factor RsiW